MTKPDSKMEIIPAGSAEFALLEKANMHDALALIDDHVTAGSFSILNLQRIRVASGGAVNFRIDTAAGEQTARHLSGILIAARQARIYWKSRNAGKKPPDCTSTDGFTGEGDPGGSCRQCPYSRWGSAVNLDGSPSRGQACKDVRQALFLLDGQLLPHLLAVPPTSVTAFGHYMLGLGSSRLNYWGVMTELSLEKATAEGGQEYAKILFRQQSRLTPPEESMLRPYHDRLKELLIPTIVDVSAYEVLEDTGPATAAAPPPTDADVPF